MPALVAAIGISMVIISKQIDISIGATFGICATITGLLANHIPFPLAMLAAIGVGTVLGACNGWLVAYLKLPSIVVTLATMVIGNEALRLWQQGRLLSLPEGVQWFGLSQTLGQVTIILSATFLLVIAAWIMKNLYAGRHIYAVGSAPEAARLAGISSQRTTASVFALMGALAGVAAVLNLVQSPQVQPTCGDGLELKVIAAAVIGGISINGGRGNLWGMLPGLLLLGTVNPALTYFHIPPYWEKTIQGLVILLAVIADGLQSRKQRLP
jgi:rhamnose transport system permease protein